MCCTRLAENTGRKNSPKIRHLRTIAQLYRVMSSQLTHVSAIGKKLLNSNISSTFPHNMVVNFGSLMAEIGWRVWGTQQSSAGFASWFSYCTDVAQRRSTKLCTMFGRLLVRTLYIHFRELLPPNESLPGAKFTLRPNLAFVYIGSVTARHSSSGRHPNCGVQQRALAILGRAAITFCIGPHSSFFYFWACLHN